MARQVCRWSNGRHDHRHAISIGVTSLESKSGCSTISFNLAAALTSVARDKVLLVESDFGKQFLSRRLGNSRTPGLAELILGVAEMEECLLNTPLANLSVLGSGRKNDQDAVELPFEQLDHVMDEKLDHFGFVVFDLPVANHLTACYSIVPKLDGVILAVDANQIEQKRIDRFKKQLADLGVEILGVVVNKS